jgi:hypothetical protein
MKQEDYEKGFEEYIDGGLREEAAKVIGVLLIYTIKQYAK